MWKKIVIALTLVIGLFAGLPHADAVTEDERKVETKLLGFINAARADRGLVALVENAVIRGEARRHSSYMNGQGVLSHDNLDDRKAAIAADDSGIDEDKICELVAKSTLPRPGPTAKGIFEAWRGSRALRRCLFNKTGFTTQSAGVGVQFSGGIWWVTFIAAHDTNP